jgi:hypothetical protein
MRISTLGQPEQKSLGDPISIEKSWIVVCTYYTSKIGELLPTAAWAKSKTLSPK